MEGAEINTISERKTLIEMYNYWTADATCKNDHVCCLHETQKKIIGVNANRAKHYSHWDGASFCWCAELDQGETVSGRQPSKLSGQSLIDYLGKHLRVNYVRSATGGNNILLTNSGPLDIPPTSRWTIYFSHHSRAFSCVLVAPINESDLRLTRGYKIS